MEHHAAVLAIFFGDLGRRYFINALTSGALDLGWTSDELEHASAVVANQMTLWLWGNSLGDTELTVWHVHEKMLVSWRDVVTLKSHRITHFHVDHCYLL